jgi:predicted restriction endonuclease
VEAVVEAAHIVPFKDASPQERLDPNNGLPLAAHVHKLFDAGCISFSADGAIHISDELTDADRETLGIDDEMKLNRLCS